MPRCKVLVCFASLLLLLQDAGGAPTSPVPCNISAWDAVSRVDSLSLRLDTPGRNCSFNVSAADPETAPALCLRRGSALVPGNGTLEAFACALVRLEPGTSYALRVRSLTDGETLQVTARTLPSQVTGLTLTSRTCRSLTLSWQAGPGRTDSFSLELSSSSWQQSSEHEETRRETLRNDTAHRTLTHLTPGRRYNVTVATLAGGLRNSRTMEAQTAPAPVANLTAVVSNSTSLSLSWQRPDGDLDAVSVALSANDTVVWQATPPPNATQLTVDGLTPGSAYGVTATSRSGDLTSQSELSVRTPPAPASRLSLSACVSGGLILSWAPPPSGFWDGYGVFLFDGLRPVVNATAERDAQSFAVPAAGLVPGRTYRAVLRVEGGGLASESGCEGSTVPAAALDLHIRHSDETSLSAMWSHAPSGSRDGYSLTIANDNGTVATREVEPHMRECTFNVLTPGRRYVITVATRRGTLNSSVSVEGRTDPMALRSITLSSAGVDSLLASWEKPRGDVDSYALTLLHDSDVVQNLSVPAASSSVVLRGLRPGDLYRLEAAAVSGGRPSAVVGVEGRTSPASVSMVTVANGGRSDALHVSWRPAPGALDSYLVRLLDRKRTVHTLAVSRSSPPECSFSSLVPGRLYQVAIATRSGNMENVTAVTARTQPATVQNPTAIHSARDDFLKVYWRHAAGDLDRYVVLIRYNHSVLQNQSVSAGHNECFFSSLSPGRLYTVTVETWSGSSVSSVSTDGRTFPAAVGNLSLGNAGTTDLTVTWSPAPGDVDHYEVTLLFNDTRVFPPVTLGSHEHRHRLTSLTPGRLYKMVVSTFSGPNQRAQFIEGRTVPSPVGNLLLAPRRGPKDSVAGLLVSWTPGDGDLDMFVVTLSAADAVAMEPRLVPKHVSYLDFPDLVPGHAYTVTVQSLSGKLSNTNAATARTAPAGVTALQADNDHTTHSLAVSWEKPVGVFDGYALLLLDEAGAVVANRSLAAQSRGERLEGLTSGRRYRVKVVTLSGGVPSAQVTAVGQTRPAAVTHLAATSSNTSCLTFSWQPPDGHVEIYDLSLYLVAEATANRRPDAAGSRKHQVVDQLVDLQKVGGASAGVAFSGLRAGSLYRLQVVSWSRDLSSESSILARTVPSPASSLQLDASGHTDRLTLSWTHAEGSWSSYQVVLFDVSGATLGSQMLGAEHQSHVFPGLIPGRLYRGEVITHSGELTNNISAFGRTSPEPPTHLSVKQGSTNESIELSWSGPNAGDYDDFGLQWTPPDRLSITRTHLSGRAVSGMFPGRRYNFTVATVSGGGARGGPSTRSQPIQRSVRTSPSPLRSMHCLPLSSSSLSCSWSAPLSDFDSYEVECRRHDNGELTSALRLSQGVAAVTLERLEPYRKYSVTVRVSSAGHSSPPATRTAVTMIDRPPVPPPGVRVSERSSKVTPSSILFRFNCSWFSDANGAVRYFAVVVAESDAAELLQPEQRHPLPSYRDYISNSSVRAYQSAYFSSRCPQDTDTPTGQVVEVNLGAGGDRLGGACDRYHDDDLYLSDGYGDFCDGPLKPRTSYRLSVRAFTKLFDENNKEFPEPLFTDTYLSTPLRTHAEPLGGVVEGLSAGMFLIGIMVAVVSLLVYRQRLRKV